MNTTVKYILNECYTKGEKKKVFSKFSLQLRTVKIITLQKKFVPEGTDIRRGFDFYWRKLVTNNYWNCK